jgi:hypothetical protein
VLDFVDSRYTFLNGRLAKFYGVPGVDGEKFRRVDLPEGSPRGGVLTMGAVLTLTSNTTRTSPVKRGLFVLDQMLGAPPPPPPADIPPLEQSAATSPDATCVSGSGRTRPWRAAPRAITGSTRSA